MNKHHQGNIHCDRLSLFDSTGIGCCFNFESVSCKGEICWCDRRDNVRRNNWTSNKHGTNESISTITPIPI